MNIKYWLGAISALPLLPLLYFQANRIKKEVPILPEATGTEGLVLQNHNKKFRLLTIGESTIAGVGVQTNEEGFTGTLARELANRLDASVHWNVHAKSGYSAKMVKDLILPTIPKMNADLIVIGLGANDAFTANSPSQWKKDIQSLLNELREKFGNTPIAFLNMPPIKEFPAFTASLKYVLGNLVEIFGEELQGLIAKQKNTYFNHEIIRLQEWKEKFQIEANRAAFFSDGVHPSKMTYQAWAKDFANFLMSIESIRLRLKCV